MISFVLTAFTYVLMALVLLLLSLCYYLNNNFDYWKKRNVPYHKPEPFLGNFKEFTLLRKSMQEIVTELYREFEGQRYIGVFLGRTQYLMVMEPEIIKSILVKDFNHFEHRGMVYDEKKDPLSAHLFNLGGHKWKKLRTKLTPTFTSGKMKLMFHLMKECSQQMQCYLEEPAFTKENVELREITSRFTTDVIGSCAFGLQLHSMNETESEFRKMGRKVFTPTFISNIRRLMGMLVPELAKLIYVRYFNEEMTEFFTRAVTETIRYREKNNVRRNDFLQLLIQLRKGNLEQDFEPIVSNGVSNGYIPRNESKQPIENGRTLNGQVKNLNTTTNGYATNGSINSDKGKNGYKNGFNDFVSKEKSSEPNGSLSETAKDDDEIELTDHLIAAQAFVFFLAGFETSATTMSFALLELALNPDIQQRVVEEIERVLAKHEGNVSYESVQEMEYLDNIISETLRKYPPGHVLVRECTKDYNIQNSSFKLEKNTRVIIPVYAIHHDTKYYPDPERFDPDRFTEEIKATRPSSVYLPFGDGPRLCIGMRFGLLQTKVGLMSLLSKYHFEVCEKTVHPIVMEPGSFVTTAKDGIWLKVTCR